MKSHKYFLFLLLFFLTQYPKISPNDETLNPDEALHNALFYKLGIENIKLALDKGANINKQDNEGCTPLLDSISYENNIEVIKLLLSRGAAADINYTTRPTIEELFNAVPYAYDTPLMEALTRRRSLKIIKLLVDNGAIVSPIHLLFAKYNEDVFNFINECCLKKNQ